MNSKAWLLIPIILLTSILSCKRDEATRWNVNVEAPIASGRLFVSDLVPEENISYDSEGLVHFMVNESLTDFNVDSLLVIPDTSFIDHIANTFATLTIGPGGLIIPPESGDALMDIPNVQLKELVSKSGTLEYKLKNFVDGDLLATYALPKATQGGESIEITEPLSPGSFSDPSVLVSSYDLSNYHFDLSGVNEDSFNQMFNQISLFVDPDSPTNVVIPVQDTIIKTEISFVNPVVSYARGYFGQHEFDFNETIELDQLSNIISGELNIEGVEVKILVENYAGIDAQVVLNEITGKNTNTGNTVTLEHADIQNNINISRAIDFGGEVSPDVFTIVLNEGNSNIDLWIENLPDSLVTSTSVDVNPLGDVTSGNDFIYTDQALQANLEVDLPLCVSMNNILFEDFLEIDIDLENEVEGRLIVELDNAFPLDGTLNLSVVDSDDNEVHNLLSSSTIVSGDALDFYSVIPSQNSFEIFINSEIIQLMKDNPRIKVGVNLSTFENDIVKFTSANYIDIAVYMDAEIEISFE